MNKPMTFDTFTFGTQYYRAPTPLPNEWEGDLEHIAAMGFDCIQLRMLWRKNERIRGVYEFDDMDRLIELAQKNGVKVIIKFLLENAPDYVFNELDGAAIRPDGIPIDYTGNGAFYLGGHRPCFDNPEVMKAALEFVRRTVERYKDTPNLILWNVWNEPRIRTGECACRHSKALFHEWLKKRFGTIEALNDFWGKAYDSFKSIQVPQSFRTYADMFLWRQWSHTTITENWLQPLYNLIKELDHKHPVMAHVGCCNMVNDPVDDLTDDFENAKIFDFYGTSLPCGEHFENAFECSLPFLITSRLYDCSPYFWCHELYPEWGDWTGRLAPSEFRYKVMGAVAGGAKSVILWQYRAERLGHENDLAGIVNIDGTPKAITHECERLISELKEYKGFLGKAMPVTDPIGILFDLPSELISTIENRSWNGDFLRKNGGLHANIDAIQGIFALFHDMKLSPRIIDSRHLADVINSLKVLYLPEFYIVTDEIAALLKQFAENGGTIIAEEGLALRQPNTWLNYPWPGNGMRELFGITLDERVDSTKIRQPWLINGIESLGYNAAVIPNDENTQILQKWDDGRVASTRRGNCIYSGFSPGAWCLYSIRDGAGDAERYAAAKALMTQLLAPLTNLPELPEKVFVSTLQAGDERLYVVFNRSDVPAEITLDGKKVTIEARDSRIIRN